MRYLAFTLLLVPAISMADCWTEISESTAGNKYLYESCQAAKPSASDHYKDLWVKTINAKTAKNGADYDVSLIRYFCSEMTHQVRFEALYKNNGERVSSSSYNGQPSPVIPDSVGQTIFAIACPE